MTGRVRPLAFAFALGAGMCLLPLEEARAQDWSRIQDLMDRARAQAAPGSVRRLAPGDAPAYGTTDATDVSVGAYAFQGAQPGDHLFDDGNGYRYLQASATDYLAAPLSLPSGAAIYSLSVSTCSTTGGVTVGLYDGNWGGQPITLIKSLTTDSPGCILYGNFFDPIQYASPIYHPLYLVIHWEGPNDGSLKFNAVTVGYRRVVSPAPPLATFNDVATTDPFFQFIEALAYSGITAGCGSGNFCPNAPLTRGQMAVFLSKALGLHWPG